MTENRTKKQLLEEYNYKYDFNREIYFNKKDKKIFSQVAIEDNNEQWLAERLGEPTKNKWTFYFNKKPSAQAEQQILRELNEK